MGFALYMDEQVAWAHGTHEYRPMGTAAIARSDLFSQRHFRPARRLSPPPHARFIGYFASLGEMNQHLLQGRAQPAGIPTKPGAKRLLPIL